MSADVGPPDIETRVVILQRLAASEDIFLPDNVGLFVASKVRSTSLLRSKEEHWAQCGLCSCVVDGDVTTSDFVVHRVWRRP